MKPVYLKSKGMKLTGVYVRQHTTKIAVFGGLEKVEKPDCPEEVQTCAEERHHSLALSFFLQRRCL